MIIQYFKSNNNQTIKYIIKILLEYGTIGFYRFALNFQ